MNIPPLGPSFLVFRRRKAGAFCFCFSITVSRRWKGLVTEGDFSREVVLTSISLREEALRLEALREEAFGEEALREEVFSLALLAGEFSLDFSRVAIFNSAERLCTLEDLLDFEPEIEDLLDFLLCIDPPVLVLDFLNSSLVPLANPTLFLPFIEILICL